MKMRKRKGVKTLTPGEEDLRLREQLMEK